MRGRKSYGPMFEEKTRRHQAFVRWSREPREDSESLIVTTYEVLSESQPPRYAVEKWREVSPLTDVEGVLLARPDKDGRDGYRVWLRFPDEEGLEDGEEPKAQLVFPCRVCGWNQLCPEGCHS
jgi:hypothetical protein